MPLRIGELAELAHTTTRAIRHYEAIGLLEAPARDASGYRRYGAEHVVALVRIRRLRNLNMPLDLIAEQLAPDAGDMTAALRSLADELQQQIDSLRELRARVLNMAASSATAAPVETWSAALREHGLLDEAATLPAGEEQAVELLDALHPEGIDGVVAQASALMAQPAVVERLGPLLQRFRALPADADDATIDALAADYAAVVPRPESGPPPIDFDTMDKLVGDRLSPAQRECLRRMRRLLEAPGG